MIENCAIDRIDTICRPFIKVYLQSEKYPTRECV